MVRIARSCGLVLLVVWLIVGHGLADEPPKSSQAIRVAVYDDTGVSKKLPELLSVLDEYSYLTYDRLKGADIRAGKLAEYDVVIHPGGSGSKQAKGLEEAGREQVRAFVEAGGGYLGICAGSYLASNNYSWSLNILDAKVIEHEIDDRARALSLLPETAIHFVQTLALRLPPGEPCIEMVRTEDTWVGEAMCLGDLLYYPYLCTMRNVWKLPDS